MISNSFYPDWDYGPSDIIKTFLDIKNIELSSLNSNQQAVIDRFLMDDSISDNESIQVLSEIFNCDSVFWENIFRQYERNIIRIEEAEVDENYGEFQELLNDLAEANWLSKTNSKYINQSNLKAFFNIPSHQLLDYTIIYEDTIGSSNFKRISDYVSSNLNLATLIKKAEWELKKQNIDILWDRQLFSENLQKIKLLSKKRGIKNFSQELNRLCNEAGVGLIILETLPQTPIRGISKFTNDGRPFIVITTKYNLDHIFWQTFFHEAAHLLLHSNQKIHLDEGDDNIPALNNPMELEADEFMVSQLLQPFKLSEVLDKIDFKLMKRDKIGSWKNIANVAEQIQISPSLLTGLLKREKKIPYSYFSESHKPVFTLAKI
ncbi:MAG: hypothetical protein VB956_02175 [Moraxella sp.]